MVSFVKNGKNFRIVRQNLCMEGDAAAVSQVWQDTELLQHHQFMFYSKIQEGATELFDASALCSAWAGRPIQSNLGVSVLTGRSRGANCSKKLLSL